ncbi:hypothetical protein Ocin01_09161 [Orchesella cincta]|uniref:Uncharacterized protein n=1 Tax=Orchesella cincta TaxID=48709 RepID=A0A1D2MWU0_ORCCI|nr:hypothetical protein Ocin01_09161 [Orchesella cincta]
MLYEFEDRQTFLVEKESSNEEKQSIVQNKADGAGDCWNSQKDENVFTSQPLQDGHQNVSKLDKGVQVPPSPEKGKGSLRYLKRIQWENLTFSLLIVSLVLGLLVLYAVEQGNRDLAKKYAQAQETLTNKEEQIRKLHADATLARVTGDKDNVKGFMPIEWAATSVSNLIGSALRLLDMFPGY